MGIFRDRVLLWHILRVLVFYLKLFFLQTIKKVIYYSNSFVPVPLPLPFRYRSVTVPLPFRYLFVRHRSLAVPKKFLIVPGPFPHRSFPVPGLKRQITINVTVTVTVTVTINVTVTVTVTVTFKCNR